MCDVELTCPRYPVCSATVQAVARNMAGATACTIADIDRIMRCVNPTSHISEEAWANPVPSKPRLVVQTTD